MNTFIVLTMIYLVVVNGLFITGCVKFLKTHTLWELVISPVQFWSQPTCLAALVISTLVNIIWFAYFASASKK